MFDAREEIILRWINFQKSSRDLGREPSIQYYEKRSAELTDKRAEYFQSLTNQLKAGKGETLIETIVSIIHDKKNIEFIPE